MKISFVNGIMKTGRLVSKSLGLGGGTGLMALRLRRGIVVDGNEAGRELMSTVRGGEGGGDQGCVGGAIHTVPVGLRP